MLQKEFEFKSPECSKILGLLLLFFGLVWFGFFFYCQSVYSDPSDEGILSLMSHVPQPD